MKTTCKQCKRRFNSLHEAMARDCDNTNCKLNNQEVMMPAKVNTIMLPAPASKPSFINHQVKLRVMRTEDEVVSHFDPSEKCLYVDAPKAIVIKIYPKGKPA